MIWSTVHFTGPYQCTNQLSIWYVPNYTDPYWAYRYIVYGSILMYHPYQSLVEPVYTMYYPYWLVCCGMTNLAMIYPKLYSQQDLTSIFHRRRVSATITRSYRCFTKIWQKPYKNDGLKTCTYGGVRKTMPKTLFSSSFDTDIISAPVFLCLYNTAVALHSLIVCSEIISNPSFSAMSFLLSISAIK